jgi:hypothetical protein
MLLEKEKSPKRKDRLLSHIKQSAGLRSKRAIAYNYAGVRNAITANLIRLRVKIFTFMTARNLMIFHQNHHLK